jgi:restriction system protein
LFETPDELLDAIDGPSRNDVAAVRELYGTVMSEGANRGILVTTSHYGRDAYEWAINKPLTLIDGPNLLSLLTKHGYQFAIDISKS